MLPSGRVAVMASKAAWVIAILIMRSSSPRRQAFCPPRTIFGRRSQVFGPKSQVLRLNLCHIGDSEKETPPRSKRAAFRSSLREAQPDEIRNLN